MAFEKYSPQGKRSDRAVIAISRRRLQINRICQRKHFKDCGFAELYFDRDNLMVGIKPLAQETRDSIIIRRYESRGVAIISAAPFIEKFHLDRVLDLGEKDETGNVVGERSVQIPAEWDGSQKMVILKLK